MCVCVCVDHMLFLQCIVRRIRGWAFKGSGKPARLNVEFAASVSLSGTEQERDAGINLTTSPSLSHKLSVHEEGPLTTTSLPLRTDRCSIRCDLSKRLVEIEMEGWG